jgi:hypothetical protein
MNEKKIKKWIFNLKRLPNTKKGMSSALCDAVLVVCAVMVYFTAKAMGYKLGTNWLIGFVVGAKLLATLRWSQTSRPKFAKVKLINSGYQNKSFRPSLRAA